MEKYIVKLDIEEREYLLALIKVGQAAAYKLTHARILLSADESQGETTLDAEIGRQLHVYERTVHRIRKRFVEEGLESAIGRKPMKKRGRKIDGEKEARLVTIACSAPPQGSGRWTLKLLANKMVELEIFDSVSPATIGRTLKKTN